MAMQWWEAKRERRWRTFLYITIFLILAVAVAFLFELSLRYFALEGYTPPMPYLGFALIGFIILVSSFYYLAYKSSGGSMVAEAMGGWKIERTSLASAKEEQLYNIVEEMAIASRLPVPDVYIIKAHEINAFAAGMKPKNAAIAVTTGALEQLNREELQGVIAHEFGHIASGDMIIGMRLAALLMGFFLVFYIGVRLLEGSLFFGRGRNGNGGRGNSGALIALLLFASGAILWFAGTILRACVSRQREYLADASAVEFTRNPHGIASALRKIKVANEKMHDMPKSGMGYAHLYFDNRSFFSHIFATHPPLEKRIDAIIGKKS